MRIKCEIEVEVDDDRKPLLVKTSFSGGWIYVSRKRDLKEAESCLNARRELAELLIDGYSRVM